MPAADVDLPEARTRHLSEAAPDRVAGGCYGACCRCGGEVEAERLAADPATPFCAECATG
jgi:RNA polymerase-binding transcription factor DksA